jgi:hypothetical protein
LPSRNKNLLTLYRRQFKRNRLTNCSNIPIRPVALTKHS